MNIRRTGERKNIAVFAILPTVCEGCVIFTTSQPRGLAIAKAIGGLTRRNAVPPSGRPVQHLTPITSFARFEGVLRTLKIASGCEESHT